MRAMTGPLSREDGADYRSILRTERGRRQGKWARIRPFGTFLPTEGIISHAGAPDKDSS